MKKQRLSPGAPVYVPGAERAAALSLGAVMIEGDARLHVPSPLPKSVDLASFSRWVSPTARMIWISELLEAVLECRVDLNDIAGLVDGGSVGDDGDDETLVPLFVPRFEMDNARHIPGVSWDRRRRTYVADASADFGLVFRYLTPAMRAIWIAERNVDTAMNSLVRARAIIEDVESDDEIAPLERLPSDGERKKEDG
ncbi:hypothetical protein ACOI1H_16640 [Loktanella sp. DJP18]|uniref:hypothetical protein n=1 Tax=Loktanella sp. DJP18 TaxID=3409788 RepID=UPI003BB6B877